MDPTSLEPTLAGDDALLIEEKRPSPIQRIVRHAGWIGFALFCLMLFTFIKIPRSRLENYVEGHIQAALASQGWRYSSRETDLSLGFGISYSMKGVEISAAGSSDTVQLDELTVTPSLGALALGKLAARVQAQRAGGELETAFSVQQTGNHELSASFELDELDLGKTGILNLLGPVKVHMKASGEGSVSGQAAMPKTWDGDIDLELKNIVIPEQSVMGFPIPQLKISAAQIQATTRDGKLIIKEFKLGKPGTQDDIIATITGNVILPTRLEAADNTTLNLKTQFRLSEKIMKAFGFVLEGFLRAARQPDGSYSYLITGPLRALNPTPVGSP